MSIFDFDIPLEPRRCKYCGKWFTPKLTKKKKGGGGAVPVYCSDECRKSKRREDKYQYWLDNREEIKEKRMERYWRQRKSHKIDREREKILIEMLLQKELLDLQIKRIEFDIDFSKFPNKEDTIKINSCIRLVERYNLVTEDLLQKDSYRLEDLDLDQ